MRHRCLAGVTPLGGPGHFLLVLGPFLTTRVHPWIRANPVETGSEEERGWNPLWITKQRRETPQIALEITLAAGGRSLEKKRVQMRSQGLAKEFYTQGYRTCPVKGPDLSSETPDRTCLVRFGFPDLELVTKNLVIYNLAIDHNLAQIDHVEKILKNIYTQGIVNKKWGW
jgi:hypothetical protein